MRGRSSSDTFCAGISVRRRNSPLAAFSAKADFNLSAQSGRRLPRGRSEGPATEATLISDSGRTDHLLSDIPDGWEGRPREQRTE